MYKVFLTAIFVFIAPGLFAQTNLPTDYLTLGFHKGRREAARALMPDSSVMVVVAFPKRNYSNDVDYNYHPNPDLYYFTGYKEPNGILFLFKEPQKAPDGSSITELFFVQDHNPQVESWEGRRLGPEGVEAKLQVKPALPIAAFPSFALNFSAFQSIIMEGLREDVADDPFDSTDLYNALQVLRPKLGVPDDFNPHLYKLVGEFTSLATPENLSRFQQIIREYPAPGINRHPLYMRMMAFTDSVSLAAFKEERSKEKINPTAYNHITGKLRELKTPEEMVLLRKAIEISCNGQNEVMKTLKPALSEMEIQGLHEYIHKKYGAESVGYGSIIGAGENGCTLHYTLNNRTSVGNDLVLMDVGAEYHGYTADVTRTIPADGKFSAEERAIYQLVYDAQEAAFRYLKDSASWRDVSKAATAIIAIGLIKLGIIQKEEEVASYYPHGLGHHLGLDVHDKSVSGILLNGMVITIEPGIYIPEGSKCDKKWWGIGVRIEDDLLIRDKDYELLSHFAPRSIDAIEKMMAEKSQLDNYRVPELKTGNKTFNEQYFINVMKQKRQANF